jgi:hypothetical protein
MCVFKLQQMSHLDPRRYTLKSKFFTFFRTMSSAFRKKPGRRKGTTRGLVTPLQHRKPTSRATTSRRPIKRPASPPFVNPARTGTNDDIQMHRLLRLPVGGSPQQGGHDIEANKSVQTTVKEKIIKDCLLALQEDAHGNW